MEAGKYFFVVYLEKSCGIICYKSTESPCGIFYKKEKQKERKIKYGRSLEKLAGILQSVMNVDLHRHIRFA